MKKKISKTELIDIVYEKIPKIQLKQVDLVVNSFLNAIRDKLKDGASIEMRGFGSFEVVPSPSKRINMEIAKERKFRVRFKAGKDLRENLSFVEANNGEEN